MENVEEFSVELLSTSQVLQTINTTSVNVTIFEDPSDGKLYLLCNIAIYIHKNHARETKLDL